MAHRKRGIDVRKQLEGDAVSRARPLADFSPDLANFVDEVVFERVWARTGLDIQSRLLVTLAALIALRQTTQLKTYTMFALNNGVSKKEIIEIVIHMAIYAGFPAADSAIRVIKDVFVERNL